MFFNRVIGFNFYNNRKQINAKNIKTKVVNDTYKLLSFTFKKMYCLISKPVFVFKQDQIQIHLFYYLFLP